MKRVIAMLLIALLVAPPASAAQAPDKPIAWEKVQTLKAGSTIFVTTGGAPTMTQLLFADEATLFTTKTPLTTPPKEVVRALYDVRAEWPAVARGEKDLRRGDLRVSKDGVFGSAGKLYDLADVVQVTSRHEVTQIARARGRHEDSGIHRFFAKVDKVVGAVAMALFVAVSVLAAVDEEVR
jgi:hypothetical protein